MCDCESFIKFWESSPDEKKETDENKRAVVAAAVPVMAHIVWPTKKKTPS